MKKYTNIVRYGHSTTNDYFSPGDLISIGEKLDGANASFKLSEESFSKIQKFSRNQELDEDNQLKGFVPWVDEHINSHKLSIGYIYYGEWMVKHTIQYPQNVYQNFYLFDVYDSMNEQWLSCRDVIAEAKQLGIEHVPIFYIGPYISYEHLLSFVGKTELGGETGEGIVIKNDKYLRNKPKRGPRFVKIVIDRMAERGSKGPKIHKANPLAELMKECVTMPRVDKMILKEQDMGNLAEDEIIATNMRNLIYALKDKVYEDVLKEERDSFEGFDETEIQKVFNKTFPAVLKKVISERSGV